MKLSIAMFAVLAFASAASASSSSTKVLLLPVTTVGTSSSQWIGDALRQSLHTDLRGASIAHVAASFDEDQTALAALAHNAAADYLVAANAQTVDDQIRLTATVFNKLGVAIGSTKVTGDTHHLFDLEDSLADQIRDRIDRDAPGHRTIASKPIPEMQSSGPLVIATAKQLPVGTVPESYGSEKLRDGHDRFIYQVPFCGYFGGCGYGDGCGYGYGGFGIGGFGFGGANIGFATGGTQTTGW